MKRIYSSATRLVFLLITLSACIAFFIGKLSQENFMLLATASFSYYFTKKQGDGNEPQI